MKQISVLFLLLFTVTISSSQETEKNSYLADDHFYTVLTDGMYGEVPVKLKILGDAVEKIKNSEVFKDWKDETYSDPENAGFLEKHKDYEPVELFLRSEMRLASLKSKYAMKSDSSYKPISKSEGTGFISFNDEGTVKIVFPVKGQNGYGNYIVSKAYYSVWLEEGDKVSDHFISN